MLEKGQLGFLPDLPTLKHKYYAKMKAFIEFPGSKFKGLDNSDIFSDMIPKNCLFLVNVYEKAEKVFSRLEALADKYSIWGTLSEIDIHSYLKEKHLGLNDYAANFDELRAKRKEIEQLPDFEVIDSMKVSLHKFTADVEDQLQCLHDFLLISLRSDILKDFTVVDDYLESSVLSLTNTPSTLDEITKAQIEFRAIVDKRKEMKNLSFACKKKMSLLIQHAVSRDVVDTNELAKKIRSIDKSKVRITGHCLRCSTLLLLS